MPDGEGSEHPAITTPPDHLDMPDYKPDLDEAALRAKKAQQDEQQQQNQSTPAHLVQKVSQYVPIPSTVTKIFAKDNTPSESTPNQPAEPPAGPPDRPDNDPQIEAFVRDQHRSKRILGDDEV